MHVQKVELLVTNRSKKTLTLQQDGRLGWTRRTLL